MLHFGVVSILSFWERMLGQCGRRIEMIAEPKFKAHQDDNDRECPFRKPHPALGQRRLALASL
jgi:hypothetical protein